MERLKAIKDQLVSCVESEIRNGLACVNTEELGEAIDMIKDMEEAMYYCSVVKAMEDSQQSQEMMTRIEQYKPENRMHYPKDPYYHVYPEQRDMDRDHGRMYYPDQGGYADWSAEREAAPAPYRDVREGKSPMSRKHYMETKEMHKDSAEQKKELEHYIQELSEDITEMIKDASAEEKTMLSQKLTALASSLK